MRRMLCLCLLSAFALLKSDSPVFAQKESPSSYDLLRAEVERFNNYGQDFLDFAKSSSDLEWQYAMELQRISGETADRLDAASMLLKIDDALSCQEDREKIRPIIQSQIGYYRELTDQWIGGANVDIAATKQPGVAAEAARMRDDLREIKTILDSIKLR